MINIKTIKEGNKVHYRTKYNNGSYALGIVKEIPENSKSHVRVVFHCNNDWADYKSYTAALTHVNNLHLGWNVDED